MIDIRKRVEWRLRWLRRGAEWRLERLRHIGLTLRGTCVYRIALLYRRLLRRTVFIGVTGSAGKTTAKDFIAAILEQHFPNGRKGAGTLNGPYDVAALLLRTRPWDAYCVTEIAITEFGIDMPIEVFRPTVGVVTNIGGDHLSAYGGIDGLVAQKSKLVQALPAHGIAVLNADDPRVVAMRSQVAGRVVTYGLGKDAMLRGTDIEASWPNRLSFTVEWNEQSMRVQTRLCGGHWVPVVLAALATGLAMGVPLAAAVEAVAGVESFEGRMSPLQTADGVTFIRDDWKAPSWTFPAAFDFLRQARAARKIMLIGTISDYTGPSTKRYVAVAREALEVADCVLFVGVRASAAMRAKRKPDDALLVFPSLREASAYLRGYLRTGDLVLLKGSTRADHLQRLVLDRTAEVACWRSNCRRGHFCGECEFQHVPSNPDGTTDAIRPPLSPPLPEPDAAFLAGNKSTTVIVGLGNPPPHRADTRHNVGYHALEILARRTGQDWVSVGNLAKVCRGELSGTPVCLVKPLATMNDVGPPLRALANILDFDTSQCILVHDDLDLPLGTVRARPRGGDGGHRGVRSVLQAFQDDRFRRVKIGVGKPAAGQPIEDHVLAPFPPEQLATVTGALQAAADRVIELISVARSASALSPPVMPVRPEIL